MSNLLMYILSHKIPSAQPEPGPATGYNMSDLLMYVYS